MAAPENVLGKAIRNLEEAPSVEWIAGFDAGYDATITVIKDVLKTHDTSARYCDEIQGDLEKIRQTALHLSRNIRAQTRQVREKSRVSKDLKKR